MDITQAVAQNIRGIRERKKLTLDAAAKVTGVSRSMLAQIEKGDVNPTISVLWKIAGGYKVSFSSLIEAGGEPITLLPLSAVRPLVEDEGRFVNYPLFPFDEQRLFETYRIVMAPEGALTAQPHLAGTEEYITVFEGEVQITVEDRSYALKKGDSIRFKADAPHSYKNTGPAEAQMGMLIYYSK
jgi:transcriptional regulator with XRE-family HTH domain